jgi:hypothetical protein
MPEVLITTKRRVTYARKFTVTDDEAATIRARVNNEEWVGLADDLAGDIDYITSEDIDEDDVDIFIDGKMVFCDHDDD